MSNDARVIPLYFITGFLGSGKTTLLNHVLEEAAARGMRLGVIINEWGQVSIDSGLVPANEGELKIEELNNGQVFCSCLTADFISALQAYAKMDLDAVIVETSGMANPFPLKKLLEDLSEKTGDHYRYEGMTALVDPENFLELIDVIPAVEEQVLASQRVVINKTDLSTPEEVKATKAKVEQINPSAQVIVTTQAEIGDFFAKPKPVFGRKPALAPFAKPKADYPRPGNYVITTTEPLELAAVREFMLGVLPHALRVKGIVLAEDGKWHYVDGVNNRVEDRVLNKKDDETKIVVIPRGGEDLSAFLRELWQKLVKAQAQFA